jgi:hypothetical protein
MILRCSASEGGGTSRFASTLIGQREVLRTTRSYSRRLTELFGAITRSEHINIEPAVMDSEIEQLPDLCAYLKFASRREWMRVRLQPGSARAATQPEPPAHIPYDIPIAAEINSAGATCAAPAPATPGAAVNNKACAAPRSRAASTSKRRAAAAEPPVAKAPRAARRLGNAADGRGCEP